MPSVFTNKPASERIAENELAFAVWDGFPVNPGHALVVPKREVATWWEATRDEHIAMLALVDEVKAQVEARWSPDGWNLGVNIGEAGGQTVFHLHLHVIPRYQGDVAAPRGGVRGVVPGRRDYGGCDEVQP
jgi:diadenosine tetraphosphate (Ap4A) HIT family hydrolase